MANKDKRGLLGGPVSTSSEKMRMKPVPQASALLRVLFRPFCLQLSGVSINLSLRKLGVQLVPEEFSKINIKNFHKSCFHQKVKFLGLTRFLSIGMSK